MDEPLDGWLTLTAAAARTGHTREAIRQRVRRGVLRATKGNDGVLRVTVRDVVMIPTPDVSSSNPGQDAGDTPVIALAVLTATMDDQRTTIADQRTALDGLRTALDKAHADHLVDRGRAERAEAQAAAEGGRATVTEARLVAAEIALAEARTPWAIRVIRAWRRSQE